MSSILYYSRYCNICEKYIQILSKRGAQSDMHYICIDKRVKEANNKTYIILENGQKIILPENVTKVPALLLLNQGYRVLYGEQILEYLKPTQEIAIRQATHNNMEPSAFSLGGGDIVSDQYSFLDQSSDEMNAVGNGGMRQMHNYVDLNTAFSGTVATNQEEFSTTIRGNQKKGDDVSNQMMEERMKKLQEDRESDLKKVIGNRPPMSY
jgi:hypothetical protein